MVLGKRKGRAYERSVYKRFRDDNRFSNVKLNLGSGSSDETSDISFSFIRKYIIECKKGTKAYCSETNLQKYWNKLKNKVKYDETPLLIYYPSYEKEYVWLEIDNIVIRMLFDDFFNKYLINK